MDTHTVGLRDNDVHPSFSTCAVTRGQPTIRAYMDDSATTVSLQSRFVGNKELSPTPPQRIFDGV